MKGSENMEFEYYRMEDGMVIMVVKGTKKWIDGEKCYKAVIDASGPHEIWIRAKAFEKYEKINPRKARPHSAYNLMQLNASSMEKAKKAKKKKKNKRDDDRDVGELTEMSAQCCK
jgi:hypothetical protein